MRVHELAKDLDLSSKELLTQLADLGIEAKSHMSTLEDDTVEMLLDEHTKAGNTDEPVPVKDDEETQQEPDSSSVAPRQVQEEAPEQEEAPGDPVATEDDKILKVRGGLTVRELAEKMDVRPNKIITALMKANTFASINDKLDLPVIKELGETFGFQVEQEKRGAEHSPQTKPPDEDELVIEDSAEDLMTRPPVVAFLGHVDHGKTSLLDRIRDTSVAKGESGGITQHIGAYTIDVNGQRVTFLDTPGHAAFTAMRARGANLTDIAIIIIAADDGIMPQTKEAIAHAKAAGVSIMVAINKVDLPTANPDRVLQQLQSEDLAPEDWGGETICCNVSAETGEGIDHLLDMIVLQADMLELTANPKRKANGFVIESQLEPGMGPTAHLLVTGGTLSVGDTILCGQTWGRIKALINDHGVQIKSAPPSTPVKCLGLSSTPNAGEEFRTIKNSKKARSMAEAEEQKLKNSQLAAPIRKASLEDLFDQIDATQIIELKVLLKADTQGSLEAITQALEDIQSDKIKLTVLLGDTGNITSNDVMLASASNAVVLGFHVAKETGVDRVAKHEGVEIRLHRVIYELIDQVRDAMIGRIGPNLQESFRGEAKINQVFDIGKTGQVAGCLITKGTVAAKHLARIKRNDETLYEGKIISLKHFQDQVKSVREAQECGIRLDHFADFQEGDIIETYEIEKHEQTL